jgi:hypothetical protein
MLDWNMIQHGRRETLDLANEFGITGFCLTIKLDTLPRLNYD